MVDITKTFLVAKSVSFRFRLIDRKDRNMMLNVEEKGRQHMRQKSGCRWLPAIGASALVFLLCAGCFNAPSASPALGQSSNSVSAEVSSSSVRLAVSRNFEVQRFAIQLTNTNFAGIARSDTDFVIIDPTGLDRSQVTELKSRVDGSRRVVVAYINIAEAETFRNYWQSEWDTQPPSWVGAINPNWENHYYTRYWDQEWQAILFGSSNSKLDQILAAGFDGVFMDGVDKYTVWPGRDDRSQRDMFTLVNRIASYARARVPGFLVIPNNAEALLDNAAYRSTIDAVVKESLFFGVSGIGRPNAPRLVDYSLGQLRRATNDGLPVFVIEYVSEPSQIDYAERRLRANGLLGTFGRRDLARLSRPMSADSGSVNRLRSLPGVE